MNTLLVLAGGVFLTTLAFAWVCMRSPHLVPATIAVVSPVHLLVLVVCYNHLGMSAVQVNVLAAWKELLLLDTLLLWLLAAAQRPDPFTVRLTPLDRLVLVYLGFNLAYVFVSPWLGAGQGGMAAILNGLRIQTTVAVAYCAARLVHSAAPADPLRLLKILVALGTAVSAFALLETVWNPLPLWNAIGIKRYLMDIAGMHEAEFTSEGVVNTYYASFETAAGPPVVWRRAGSLFLSPLTFAQVLLVTLPAAVLLAMRRRLRWLHAVVQSLALVASVSRGPLASAALGIASVLVTRGAASARARVRAMLLLLLASAFVVYHAASFIAATVSLRDPSAFSRAQTYANSIQFAVTHPFGAGLAASEQKFVEMRFGGGESEYFENISRIGWAGLACYLVVLATILRTSRRGIRLGSQDLTLLSAVVFAVTAALVCQQVVNRVWRHPFLPFVYGWIVGMWASRYYRERRQVLSQCA